jgi:hypothetical protein
MQCNHELISGKSAVKPYEPDAEQVVAAKWHFGPSMTSPQAGPFSVSRKDVFLVTVEAVFWQLSADL